MNFTIHYKFFLQFLGIIKKNVLLIYKITYVKVFIDKMVIEVSIRSKK